MHFIITKRYGRTGGGNGEIMNLLIVNDEVRTADVMKSEIEWTAYGIDQVSVAYDAEMERESRRRTWSGSMRESTAGRSAGSMSA